LNGVPSRWPGEFETLRMGCSNISTGGMSNASPSECSVYDELNAPGHMRCDPVCHPPLLRIPKFMQVIVRTDHNLSSGDLQKYVESAVTAAVDRFAQQVTRVEAHLGDNNSRSKSGADDIRCMLEARVSGIKPVAVT